MSDDITSDVADVLQMFSPFKARGSEFERSLKGLPCRVSQACHRSRCSRRGPGVSRSGHAALKVQRGVFAQFLEASFTFLLRSFLLHSKSRSSKICRKCELKIGLRQLLQRATQLKLFLQYSPVAALFKLTSYNKFGHLAVSFGYEKPHKC